MLPFPTDLTQFALWIGTSSAGGVIVALLLERVPAWKAWKSPWKARAVLGLFLALPYASWGLQAALSSLDPNILAQVQNALALGLAGLTAWAASQYGHASDPKR